MNRKIERLCCTRNTRGDWKANFLIPSHAQAKGFFSFFLFFFFQGWKQTMCAIYAQIVDEKITGRNCMRKLHVLDTYIAGDAWCIAGDQRWNDCDVFCSICLVHSFLDVDKLKLAWNNMLCIKAFLKETKRSVWERREF